MVLHGTTSFPFYLRPSFQSFFVLAGPYTDAFVGVVCGLLADAFVDSRDLVIRFISLCHVCPFPN